MDNTLGFIEALIEIEKKNKNTLYNNVYDKYLNGRCEDLVNFLMVYNNDGEKIKIKGICQEGFEDLIVTHYIYKLNGKYYDINGEFDSTQDLITEIGYFDFMTNTEIIDINTNIEEAKLEKIKSNEIYLKTIDKLESYNFSLNDR